MSSVPSTTCKDRAPKQGREGEIFRVCAKLKRQMIPWDAKQHKIEADVNVTGK